MNKNNQLRKNMRQESTKSELNKVIFKSIIITIFSAGTISLIFLLNSILPTEWKVHVSFIIGTLAGLLLAKEFRNRMMIAGIAILFIYTGLSLESPYISMLTNI